MANVTHKAVALSRHYADDLAKRFAGDLEVSESFDTDGNPVITISDGTPAAGERVIVMRWVGDPNPEAKDILGLDAIHFTPHTLQICTEENPTGGVGADVLLPQDLINVLGDAAKRSPKVEWYQSANTDVPDVSEMTSGNLKAEWSDLYWNIQRQS